jgi:hypothetical protein
MAVYNRLTRRQMLLGAGGAMLGLPILSSLFERTARAGGALGPGKNFVAFWNSHGGVSGANLYPTEPMNPTVDVYPVLGHQIRSSPLPWIQDGQGNGSISPVLTGAGLSQKIASKMNVIRGLDPGIRLGHNRSGSMGNFAGPFCDPNDPLIPTIDQVLAYSKSFTAQGATVVPYINYATGCQTSWGWSNPTAQSGQIQETSADRSTLGWFQKIFGNGTPTSGKAPIRIVDKVYEDYKRLQNHRRISSFDKALLNDHVAMIKQLENRLTAQAAAAAQCGKQPPIEDTESYFAQRIADYETNVDEQLNLARLHNELLVAAMACGACRIGIQAFAYQSEATIRGVASPNPGAPEAQGGTDWHHGVAHCHMYKAQQAQLRDSYRNNFNAMLDLISRMDAVQVAPDLTLLDNSLVFWSMECGPYTHTSQSLPVIMAGSAGNALKTGLYLDYRNITPNGVVPGYSGAGTEVEDVLRTGVPYNNWLGTVLQAMGLSPSEYETPGIGGYGQIAHATSGGEPASFAQAVYQSSTAHGYLPFIQA